MSPVWLAQGISDHFVFGYLSPVYQTMVSQSLYVAMKLPHFLYVLVKPRNCIIQEEQPWDGTPVWEICSGKKANLTLGIVNPKVWPVAYGSGGDWASGLVSALEPEAHGFSGTGESPVKFIFLLTGKHSLQGFKAAMLWVCVHVAGQECDWSAEARVMAARRTHWNVSGGGLVVSPQIQRRTESKGNPVISWWIQQLWTHSSDNSSSDSFPY